MPLSKFSHEMVTFTYPDSMASLPFATEDIHDDIRMPFHGQVFTLEEIKCVVAEFGMPDKTSPAGDRFIEVQAWDDRPIYAQRRRS